MVLDSWLGVGLSREVKNLSDWFAKLRVSAVFDAARDIVGVEITIYPSVSTAKNLRVL